MRTKRFWVVFAYACLAIICGAATRMEAQESDLSRIPTQTVTLFSQAKHKDHERSRFSFELGVRGDEEPPSRRASYDLRYGGITDNSNNHWFDVAMGSGSRRQLKDLGEMKWSDVYNVPILFASPVPHSGCVSWTHKPGKVIEISPEGVNIRAVTGHMYVMHVKDDDSDFYVMFRVESLEPEGECTINWKRVPSPEGD